jgi:hypothetical protein
MRLPTTSYCHGYSCDRRGSNAGVRSHFLLSISGWEVKTCHYTHLTAHCFATDHPRKRIRQGPYPTISGIRPYPPVLDPASTHRRSVGRKGRCGTGLGVFSPSRPRCHHGVQGWPAIPRARCYSHLYRDRQNLSSRHPGVLASSYPIKGQARALQKATQQRTNQQTQRPNGQGKPQARSHAQTSKGTPPTDQHLKQPPLHSHISFETWAQFPLSQLVTPTQALRCKEIQYSPLPAGRGASFARTRINPRVFFLHHHPD